MLRTDSRPVLTKEAITRTAGSLKKDTQYFGGTHITKMGKEQSKLRPKDVNELIVSTSYSEDELIQWYKGFLKVYPNGALMIDDFKKIYGEHFPFGDASAFAEQVFQQYDLNADDTIDFRELITAININSRCSLESKLKSAFKMYDLDSNGFISREEMTNIVKAIYKLVGVEDESKSKKRVDYIFSVMDKNHDENISETEFLEGSRTDSTIRKLLCCDVEPQTVENNMFYN